MKTSLLVTLALVLLSLHTPVQAQWVPTGGPEGGAVYSLSFRGNTLFAGTDSGAFRSTDGGSSWAPVDFGWDAGSVGGFVGDDSSFFARAGGRSLFYSADDGRTWRLVDTNDQGGWYPAGTSLFVHGGNIFATRGAGIPSAASGIYRSTDHGATWVSVLPGLLANSFAAQDSVLLVACQDAVPPLYTHLYRSSDNGSHWDPDGGLFQWGFKLTVHNGWLICGGFGIARSSDHGASWMSAQEGYGTHEVSCFAEALGALFVGSWTSGVHVSTDDGAHWKAINEGLPSSSSGVIALAVHDGTLYAGTLSAAVWRRPLSELSTSVQGGSPAIVPTSVALLQNYPNPFNPTTMIRYELAHSSRVSLKVYNMLGQEVAALVNETRPAGVFTERFDAANLASGMYFYRLQAGDFISMRKMVVLK